MMENDGGRPREVTELLLEEVIVRWEELIREGERIHLQRQGPAQPPHGGSVFETDKIRWDPIKLIQWLSLVPAGRVHAHRASNPYLRYDKGIRYGHLRVTLEAADGPTIEATEYMLFHILLTWRLESAGWVLVAVDPDTSPAERERQRAAKLYETDPFLATIRAHLHATQTPSGDTVLAEVHESRPKTEPSILAILIDDLDKPDPHSP